MSRSVSLTASYAIAIAILYIVAIAFSTAARSGVTVRHKRRDSNNTITLLCWDDTTSAYIANATFLRNSRRIDDIVYGDLSGPSTSVTFNLTPQMEGSYSCRPPETRFASNNSLELAAYPEEIPNGVYTYSVEVGQSVTMACPFPRGALPHLYSCTWIRGYGPLDENDPNFIFNPNTFEITIVNASIEDSPSDYVCQVKVENPLGNDWTVRSQQISLNVTETVDQIQPHPSSSSITSTAPSVAETSVVSPNGNPKITLVVVVGITALIIIIALISTIVVIVVLASIKRKRSVPTNDIELARTNLGSSTSIFMDTSHFQHTLSPVPIHTFRLPTNTATVHTAASSGTSSLFVKPLLETRDEYPPSCNVEFIGSIQVVDCDRQGGEYRNAEHGIHIRIPKDAVQDSIELEIGFAVHGHFTFPDHMRPVSVILWMNVADNPDFEFSKEIKVTLPHYLQLSTSDSRSKTDELGCMFAATVIEETQSEPMAFTKLDDDKVGYMQRDGCIKTKRAGYMCLCAKKSFIDANSAYYLVTVPTPIARPSDGWSIPFYMCYHLDTFVEMIKKEIGPFHEIMQTRLLFDSETNDETKISIQFARTSASKGWQLTLPMDTAEVAARSVELWEDDVSELHLRLKHKLYPPRVTVRATASNDAQTSQEVFTVTGARFPDKCYKRQKLSLTVPLTPPNR